MLMGQWCISVVRNSMECGHKRKNCCEFRLAMANDMKEAKEGWDKMVDLIRNTTKQGV